MNLIEIYREVNNTLWMNILRIALESSPSKTREIMRRISDNDKSITNLFRKIADG